MADYRETRRFWHASRSFRPMLVQSLAAPADRAAIWDTERHVDFALLGRDGSLATWHSEARTYEAYQSRG